MPYSGTDGKVAASAVIFAAVISVLRLYDTYTYTMIVFETIFLLKFRISLTAWPIIQRRSELR